MAKKILDDTALFTCQNGIEVIFGVDRMSNQKIASESGKKYLNEAAKCKLLSPGQCKCQPNPSGAGFLPCSQTSIPAVGWQRADSVIKIDGKKALVSDTMTVCPLFAGKISLKGTCNTRFLSGCSVHISPIVLKEERKENNRIAKGCETAAESNEKNPVKDISAGQKDNIADKSRKEDMLNSKYARCPYENCTEREQCEYFHAGTEINNDSEQLRKNFELYRKEEYKEYKEFYEKAKEAYSGYEWEDQAHHIIPGRQVLMDTEKNRDLKYGHLLMLVNMCGYDINNADNCILLPSDVKSGRGGKQAPGGPVVMDIMKRQWHSGPHHFTIPKDSLKYYKPDHNMASESGEYFPDYVMSLEKELDKLNKRYSRKRCWKKIDGEGFRKEFKMRFYKISKKAEEYLLKFSEKPENSFPFFVSRAAVEYAYGLPEIGKLILIYPLDDGIYASKLIIFKNRKDNDNIQAVQKSSFKIENNMRELVQYCENVMHFWIDDRVPKVLLWNTEEEYIHKCRIECGNISEFAESNKIELFQFCDKKETDSRGQIARVRKRWTEVEKYGSVYD